MTSGGVSLEHLLSCVPGVEITISSKGTKVISFQENKEPPGAGEVNCNIENTTKLWQLA